MKKQKLNVQNAAVNLHLDSCSFKAAKYAVEHWHYSKCLPVTKKNYIGVWENERFIGVVIFSLGGSPHMGAPYGLKMFEYLELARVALTKHQSFVSRIISIAIKKVKSRYPKIRLIISYADINEGHLGGIYQAGNWIYTGKSSKTTIYKYGGKYVHSRTLGVQWGEKKNIDRSKLKKRIIEGKHRYLYPLDKKMRKQIEALRQPYPKRPVSEKVSRSADQPKDGGSIPTTGLKRQERRK